KEDKLKNLIQEAKKKNNSIGEISVIEHEIILTKDFNEIPKEYHVPLNLRERVEEHIRQLIKEEIIEEKFTPCISPAFIILKEWQDKTCCRLQIPELNYKKNS
ncbi:hypothetical protein DMUE_5759, partial [Dictyocoela muelleri]